MACNVTRTFGRGVCNLNLSLQLKITSTVIVRTYAKKALKKGAAALPMVQRKYLEVESDPHKLCTTLCGGNILKDGKDPELKPDSEYPEWLWKLRLDRTAPTIHELEYDSDAYWAKVKKDNRKKANTARSMMFRYQTFK